MTGINGSFDATQFQPSQSVGTHPAGTFDAQISNTAIKPTKDGDGGLFEVEFSTPAGRISNRYNLWNKSPQATEIAHKELSALCYATGIFKLDWQNEGAALRNARCKIEVAKQANNDYMEVKRVLDVNGNEPGRAPAAAPQPQGQGQGGWSQPTQQTPTQPQQQAPQGWQPGPTMQPQQPAQAPQGWGAPTPPNAAPAAGTAPDNRPPWART